MASRWNLPKDLRPHDGYLHVGGYMYPVKRDGEGDGAVLYIEDTMDEHHGGHFRGLGLVPVHDQSGDGAAR